MLQLLDQPFPAGSLRRLPRVLVPVAAAVTVCLRPEHVDDAPAAPRMTGQTSAATPISLSRRSLWRLPRVLELVDAVAAPTPAPAQPSLVGSASSRPRLQWRRGMCCFWNLGSTCSRLLGRITIGTCGSAAWRHDVAGMDSGGMCCFLNIAAVRSQRILGGGGLINLQAAGCTIASQSAPADQLIGATTWP